MTTDVNVTEKVARAVFASRLSEGDYPEGTGSWEDIPEDWREFCRTLATAALAVLSDPEVLAGMAGVLGTDAAFLARPSAARRLATALADWLRGQG